METQCTLNNWFFSSLESSDQHLQIPIYDDGGVMVTQKWYMYVDLVGVLLNALGYPISTLVNSTVWSMHGLIVPLC